MSFHDEFLHALYNQIRQRVAPENEQLKMLKPFSKQLQQMRNQGLYDARIYDNINFRKAYLLSYFPASVAQAYEALQLEIGGELPAIERYQANLMNRNVPLRVTVLGAGPAPELLAFVSHMKYTTKTLEVKLVDINDKWQSAIKFVKGLIDHEKIRAGPRDKPDVRISTVKLDLNAPLQKAEIEEIGDGRHIVFCQNILGELSNQQTAADNLASIVGAMPTGASMLLSEQKFTKNAVVIRQFTERIEQLQRDGAFVVASPGASSAYSPFEPPDEITDSYFDRFENNNSMALRNIKLRVYSLRKAAHDEPVALPRTVDFD